MLADLCPELRRQIASFELGAWRSFSRRDAIREIDERPFIFVKKLQLLLRQAFGELETLLNESCETGRRDLRQARLVADISPVRDVKPYCPGEISSGFLDVRLYEIRGGKYQDRSFHFNLFGCHCNAVGVSKELSMCSWLWQKSQRQYLQKLSARHLPKLLFFTAGTKQLLSQSSDEFEKKKEGFFTVESLDDADIFPRQDSEQDKTRTSMQLLSL